MIHYLEYDSDFLMRNSLAKSNFSHYASGKSGSMVFAFAVRAKKYTRSLEPLTQFGFTINEVQHRR